MEAALAARAPDKELIFLSVGDTRDHRREFKDPSLRTISVNFLLNLLANLKRLRIAHYLILTTQPLCRKLQDLYCEYSCAWTSLWHDDPGLVPWNLKPGDMFLMWAQQWRYIARAIESGYRVLRSDTDIPTPSSTAPSSHASRCSHSTTSSDSASGRVATDRPNPRGLAWATRTPPWRRRCALAAGATRGSHS